MADCRPNHIVLRIEAEHYDEEHDEPRKELCPESKYLKKINLNIRISSGPYIQNGGGEARRQELATEVRGND